MLIMYVFRSTQIFRKSRRNLEIITCRNGDVNQVPYSGSTDIGRSRTKFNRVSDLVPGVLSPLHARVCVCVRIMASVVGEGMSQWDIGGMILRGGKNRKYWEKNLSQCHFVYGKSQHVPGLWSDPGLWGEKPATKLILFLYYSYFNV